MPDYSNALGTRHEYVSQADRTHTQATTKMKNEGPFSGIWIDEGGPGDCG